MLQDWKWQISVYFLHFLQFKYFSTPWLLVAFSTSQVQQVLAFQNYRSQLNSHDLTQWPLQIPLLCSPHPHQEPYLLDVATKAWQIRMCSNCFSNYQYLSRLLSLRTAWLFLLQLVAALLPPLATSALLHCLSLLQMNLNNTHLHPWPWQELKEGHYLNAEYCLIL